MNIAEDIVIGSRVWFGFDSLIQKGARIGDDTVVGAKSVVLRGDYMSNVVLSGSPAKEIRTGIVWDIDLKDSFPGSLA
jgi:acetyltransferase-like isoleucine patch superfamily enzyme